MHFIPQDIAQFVQKYDEDGSGSIDFQEFFMMISEILAEAKDAIAKKNQEVMSTRRHKFACES